jgi:hypothetical protein
MSRNVPTIGFTRSTIAELVSPTMEHVELVLIKIHYWSQAHVKTPCE